MSRLSSFLSVLGKCSRWGLGRVRFAFLEVHAFDKTVRDGINVPHLAIRKNVASETLHQLANLDISLAPFAVDPFDRFHMRIKPLPLTGPVGTNLFLPNHTTTFRCLGPADVLTHERQDAVHVSLVKSRVGLS